MFFCLVTAFPLGSCSQTVSPVKDTHQFPPLLRDGADVHRMTLYDIEESRLGDSNGTDHMDPPGEQSEDTDQGLPLFESNAQEGS